MHTLDLIIYTNNILDTKYENIPYQEKQTFYYFEIDNTKYFLKKDISSLKYQTLEEKVHLDFNNKQVQIKLIKTNYQIKLNILKTTSKAVKNTHKITYVLDSEPDIKRTILITLQ